MHPTSGVKTEELESVGIPLGCGKSVLAAKVHVKSAVFVVESALQVTYDLETLS